MSRYLSRHKFNHRLGIALLMLIDLLTLLGLYYFSGFFRIYIFPLFYRNADAFTYNLGMYYWIFIIWFFILVYEGAYAKRLTFWDEVKLLWKCTFFATLTIMTVLFIGKQGPLYSRTFILTMSLSSLVFFPLARTNAKKIIYAFGLMKRKILIVGAGEAGRLALSAIQHETDLGYEVAGFIDDDILNTREIEGVRVHRNIDGLDRYIRTCGIHDVLIAKPELEKSRLSVIINTIQHRVDSTLLVPDLPAIAVLGTELRHFFRDQAIVIEIKNNLAKPVNYVVKRTFDYLLGFFLLMLLALPFLIIVLFIRLTSQGPAIFRQERIGRDGVPFMCYKFRTMYQDAEERLQTILKTDAELRQEWDQYWKLKNDPRTTPVGKLLRQTSLDELPQILNVLAGDMSFVGPRPYLPREWNALKEHSAIIHSVHPGITGLWQVSGRSDSSYEKRLSLDSWYVRNWNLWLDIMILIKTAKVVLKKEGAR